MTQTPPIRTRIAETLSDLQSQITVCQAMLEEMQKTYHTLVRLMQTDKRVVDSWPEKQELEGEQSPSTVPAVRHSQHHEEQISGVTPDKLVEHAAVFTITDVFEVKGPYNKMQWGFLLETQYGRRVLYMDHTKKRDETVSTVIVPQLPLSDVSVERVSFTNKEGKDMTYYRFAKGGEPL